MQGECIREMKRNFPGAGHAKTKARALAPGLPRTERTRKIVEPAAEKASTRALLNWRCDSRGWEEAQTKFSTSSRCLTVEASLQFARELSLHHSNFLIITPVFRITLAKSLLSSLPS